MTTPKDAAATSGTTVCSCAVPLTFGSLFAGIGGIDLGFERAGLQCKWQVEIDAYAQKVLAKHWPNVRRHDDVRTWPQPDTEYVDIIAGGFPCQDISYAGKGAGLAGERSGLWSDYVRIVREIRPRFVVVENVSALLVRGMDRVLGDLAEIGYGAEWECVPASIIGAPHRRDRVFIVAYDESLNEAWRDKSESVSKARRHEDRRLVFSEVPERRWNPEPDVDRVAERISVRVDRLRGLGNAVVPQVAEWIGRRIVAASKDVA